jgi:23S rRNA (uracil1939-C5)-methyltransferase
MMIMLRDLVLSRQSLMQKTTDASFESLAATGDGIALWEGRPLHVPGVLPGEKARVRLVHVGRQKAHGELLELTDGAPRRDAPCPQHGTCGGCPLMMVDEAHQVAAKREALRNLGISVTEVVQGDVLAYRWSAKRIAGGVAGAVKLGSYQRGSHLHADMQGCLVDHPLIVACAEEVCEAASAVGIEPETDLRYVWLKTDGTSVLVTLVSASERSLCVRVAKRITSAKGVAWCVQPSEGNDLRGHRLQILLGQPSLRLDMCGEVVDIGPLGFLQPNPSMAARCYEDLVGSGSGALALDLYAGAGITTKLLQHRYTRVMPCESYAESAAALGITPQRVEDFLDEVLATELAPTLVVANPPRAGLGEQVCAKLNQLALNRLANGASFELHVMSCQPRALARDLARLDQFTSIDTRAYDTLPQTAHIELVAKLSSTKDAVDS